MFTEIQIYPLRTATCCRYLPFTGCGDKGLDVQPQQCTLILDNILFVRWGMMLKT